MPPATTTPLNVCQHFTIASGVCGCKFVHPLDWEQQDDGSYWMQRRCPVCWNVTEARYSHDEISAYNLILESQQRGLALIIEQVAQARMVDDTNTLIHAIQNDHLLPEDF